MKRVIPRVRSLTLASDGAGAPPSLSLFLGTFRTLPNLEHLTVATTDPIPQPPPIWGAVDTICGSRRVYDSLETVELCFASPRPASGAEYVKREELGEMLPYLTEHGMLKISDPNMYVSNTRLFLVASFHLVEFAAEWIGYGLDVPYGFGPPGYLFTCGVQVSKGIKHEFALLHNNHGIAIEAFCLRNSLDL